MDKKNVRIIATVLLVVAILYNLTFAVYTFGDVELDSKFTVEISDEVEVSEDVVDDVSDEKPAGYCETDEDCVFAELECKDNICQFRD